MFCSILKKNNPIKCNVSNALNYIVIYQSQITSRGFRSETNTSMSLFKIHVVFVKTVFQPILIGFF